MRRSRKIASWLWFLIALHFVLLAAGFFAPYDSVRQDRNRPFAPPMRIHLVDASGKFHLRPFVYAQIPREGVFDKYDEDRLARIPLRFFVKGSRYSLLGLIPCHVHFFGGEAATINILGTDGYGRDVFSRTLHGGQFSVLAGLLATFISLFLGGLIGAASGYFGRWPDATIMRLAELCLALPWLYLLFAIRAFLPLTVSPINAFFIIVVVIGAVGWARPARLVRGVALSVKERDFVRAARGFGASHIYLLRRHVLPQTRNLIFTQAAILVPQFVLAEVTLSFLGLGIPEPTPSWGNLLSSLQQYSVLSSYWWMYLPAAVMVPFFFGYLSLSSALQETRRIAKIEL